MGKEREKTEDEAQAVRYQPHCQRLRTASGQSFQELARPVSVNEAGKKGGLAVLRKHGRGFFVEIGKRGQATMRDRYPCMAKEWGRRGGRPRKQTLAEIMGERGEETTKEAADPPTLASLPQPIIQDEGTELHRSEETQPDRSTP